MTFWIDARLSPHLAPWIEATFGVEPPSVKRLGLRDAKDREVFDAAPAAEALVMTKDQDFVALQARLGAPPQIVWVTCGNTPSVNMKRVLGELLPEALRLLEAGETLVEISDARIVGARRKLGTGSLWMPLRVSRRYPES